ncbi:MULTISPECIES: hypothetical protein [Thermomonas]|jgi:hypothetical protein|uniref:DUF4440 domain-containing protein n=1 Tax=Thermomonas beijingensis TaxID=2872701 RepID=A0ABS7TFQ5_9GAMM|nr:MULTISPECIES: hypothetical protein [Thermomonas]MBS0459942.1 hypothetical protein [Pseudomonadota bacterium]MDE2382047.1 hypothetical protein [Xanthomonadaceae bacterium]MBZ4186693.1 hypothetical protein [Thermomonas beijingensis]HOC10939.1 hypothetical protein [Thermomonas sp.]HQA01760.1 hypothetical protein [Thermomonas sp.]
MFKLALRCVLIACLAMLAGCPKSASKGTALDEIQYTWSAAIRWGDFEGAWGLVDPKVREAHPMTDLDFSRFKQVQISTYRDTGSSIVGGDVVRDIEIGVINRNTLAERSVRYRERWRYDEAAKTWWLTSGMPDLWQGE